MGFGSVNFVVQIICFCVFANSVNAEVVRCEVVDRSDQLMPEWIEYEIGLRGGVIEVRDSVGTAHGIGWVRGKILENAAQRLRMSWDVGILPQQDAWWMSGKIHMTMTRLGNGMILIVGKPSAITKPRNLAYHGRATCNN